MYTILVCDDEKDIVDAIEIYLSQEGYRILKAYDGLQALEILKTEEVHLLLLDVMMPKLDGIHTIMKIRETSSIPIIVLSAKSQDSDKVLGLNLGADDYITKPFGIMELISRVKALLRRSMNMEDEKFLSAGDIFLDGEKHMVYVKDEPVDLTFKEYELLKLLIQNQGIVMSRDVIMERIWGIDFEGESRTLDVHIKTLRQKLKNAGTLIKTVRNVGYMIE